jgi:putative nucleotidyltransferase with HDIG domain
MSAPIPSREAAWSLLCKYNQEERSRRHARAVEHTMVYMARKYGEDEALWGVVGLLHDLDWEMFPEEHCARAVQILEAEGWPPEIVRAVASHGWKVVNDVEPRSLMERTLYAVDELTGLVHAAALVRPGRAIADMKAKSVKKKWGSRRFAAGVDREVIDRGAELLGVERGELITDVILAMREIAPELGLDQG